MDGAGTKQLQQPLVEKSCASLKPVGQDCEAFHKLFLLVVLLKFSSQSFCTIMYFILLGTLSIPVKPHSL